MVTADTGIVTVTGISGYIGSQVAVAFLEEGFKVRGTVRDPKDKSKVAALQEAFGDRFDQIELVAADLMDADSIMKALEGSSLVAHVASPFVLDMPADENELIRPAVEGTLGVLRACQAHGIKRVVVTSSCASLMYPKEGEYPADGKLTEESWTDPESSKISAYVKSKTLAERAAWDFVAKLPEDQKIELTTINPGFVIGPTLVGGGFASGEAIRKFMTGEFPALPYVHMPVVDVRDVAKAHVRAIMLDEAQGKRFILNSESKWFPEIGQMLSDDYSGNGYNVTTNTAPYCVMWTLSFCKTELRSVLHSWGKVSDCVNTRSKDILGIDYIPVKQSLNEMVPTLVKVGILEDRLN